MKVSISELRDMVAEAVRRTVSEAKKKPKELPPQSEESVIAQRDRHVRALPGYAHGEVLDMSKPLGRKNRAKRQGASNMGNWTSESRDRKVEAIRALVRLVVAEEIRLRENEDCYEDEQEEAFMPSDHAKVLGVSTKHPFGGKSYGAGMPHGSTVTDPARRDQRTQQFLGPSHGMASARTNPIQRGAFVRGRGDMPTIGGGRTNHPEPGQDYDPNRTREGRRRGR